MTIPQALRVLAERLKRKGRLTVEELRAELEKLGIPVQEGGVRTILLSQLVRAVLCAETEEEMVGELGRTETRSLDSNNGRRHPRERTPITLPHLQHNVSESDI